MSYIKRLAVAVGAAAGLVAAVLPVSAGNEFRTTTSTKDGYSTWDSDLIDIERVNETGAGVYVAVLDTGLVPNWKDYFPEERIATDLGKGFVQSVSFKAREDVCGFGVEVGALRETGFIGSSSSTHGTHVASTIIGYNYRSNSDAASGYVLPPIQVRGIAPEATIIPVKVLADYQLPSLPKCDDPSLSQTVNFGTSEMVAAGIDYVTSLVLQYGYWPMVINMSLGASGEDISAVEKAAIDRAIAAGVIVVASAGNEGEDGMGSPGNYAPVISAGSVGWTGEWVQPGVTPPATPTRYRMWWLQGAEGLSAAITPGSGDVPEDAAGLAQTYVSDFSSRALVPGMATPPYPQQLDVLAPGSWVRGPFPGDPGFSHLPWWSKGFADLISNNPGNFYYVGGTSMAAPHVSSLATLALQQDPNLTQAEIEANLKATAAPLPSSGSAEVSNGAVPAAWETITWDTSCGTYACDPVGAGLVQADTLLGY